MKKITNNIRIGMVPKESISSKLHGKHSPPDNQDVNNHHYVREEQFNAQRPQAMSNVEPYPDHPYTNHVTSPNLVRIHDTSELGSNKPQPHSNNINFRQSFPTTRPRQETVSELYEVPSKTKSFPTKKVLLGVGIAAAIAAIVVGVVLGVVLTRSNDTATAASTSPTTTIAPNVISVVWSFDNVANDLNNIYNGSLMNGAMYTNGTPPTGPYFGPGQALLLNGTNQFVSISSPSLLLNSTSFTIEAWIYPSTVSGDRGIFGQCQCSTCANECLYFISRGTRLFVDFTLNDLTGSTTLTANIWHHVAFVYNSQTRQQILYVNGIQDAIKSNAAPYQGVNGSIQIGATQAFGTTNFFNGLIDNVWITTRAKPADEILRDASLIVYFSFDLSNPNADNGPNKLLGLANNTITTTGRVNQAMRFVGSLSFFYMFGLYQVPTGLIPNRPFSVSLWINPSVSGSCTFVQLFSTPLTRCSNLLGIVSGGGSTGQIFVHSSNSVPATLTGPFVTQNVWTHISLTYSALIGYTLYFNGVYYGATGNVTYQTGSTMATLYIGFFSACTASSYSFAYQGSIDEVYVHNRELSQADVTLLANP